MEIYNCEVRQTGNVMENKLTLSLDSEIVKKLRAKAGEAGLSVDDFVRTRLLEVASQRKN
jgi:hypothetical protein